MAMAMFRTPIQLSTTLTPINIWTKPIEVATRLKLKLDADEDDIL